MKKLMYALSFLLFELGLAQVPKDFYSLKKLDNTIVVDLKYFTNDNFLGTRVDGYSANIAYLKWRPAKALAEAQDLIAPQGIGLKIFDAYRPQRAVDHFIRWAKMPADTLMKSRFYPDVHKKDLFARGYIASRSGHSTGSTVDLTLVYLETGKELDMGSGFDLFDRMSHYDYNDLTAKQRENRALLRAIMENAGFRPYNKEWWHFTFDKEEKREYYDFVIE